MAIKCCKGCVAPKRYPGCHDRCPEYLAEKAEYDRLMGAYKQEQKIIGSICGDTANKVYKALKDRRVKKV